MNTAELKGFNYPLTPAAERDFELCEMSGDF